MVTLVINTRAFEKSLPRKRRYFTHCYSCVFVIPLRWYMFIKRNFQERNAMRTLKMFLIVYAISDWTWTSLCMFSCNLPKNTIQKVFELFQFCFDQLLRCIGIMDWFTDLVDSIRPLFITYGKKIQYKVLKWVYSSEKSWLTLMLLVAYLANTKWCKKTEKGLKPWHMGTHMRALGESYLMNTNITGLDGFKNYCVLVSWTKKASAFEGLK